MKILVIQLTRIGDVLCTLPTLAALRREYPGAEIHLLVRKSFEDAALGSPFVDSLWRLDIRDLFGELITGHQKPLEAINKAEAFVKALCQEGFQQIINLSFSPASSYLTAVVARAGNTVQRVCGFTRASDWFLAIPDGASRYFRTQVGVNSDNRLHVADLFGHVAGVNIRSEDWHFPGVKPRASIPRRFVFHLAASDAAKTWPLHLWCELALNLLKSDPQATITLVGSRAESSLGQAVEGHCVAVDDGNSKRLMNFIGKLSLYESALEISMAEVFVGVDSGPLHIANSVGTRSLNLSLGPVRFWETGPVVPGSRILNEKYPADLKTETVLNELSSMCSGEARLQGSESILCVAKDHPRYELTQTSKYRADFWPVLEWLYLGGGAPIIDRETLNLATELLPLVLNAQERLEIFAGDHNRKNVLDYLNRVDEVIEIARRMHTPLRPLLSYFIGEKENVAPGSIAEMTFASQKIYGELAQKLKNLIPQNQTRHHGGLSA